MKDRHKKKRVLNARKPLPPSRYDPTRTTTLRRAFVAKIRRQFARLKAAVYRLIVVEDALGLKKNMTYNCRPGQIRGADGRCGPGIGVDVPRDQMPQIAQEDMTAFLTFAGHENVRVYRSEVEAGSLSPTQSEFRQERVDAMPNSALEQPVIVSSDLYVLDGTHRWIKHWQQDENNPVPVLVIDLKLRDALDLMRRFPLARFVANHIVKLPSGKYRLLSHEGKNLGTFDSREEAAKHEGEVEYFKYVGNVFCPTGPGGGVDPTCGKESSMSSEEWANSISPKEKHLVQEYLRSATWVKSTEMAPEFYDEERINEVKEFNHAVRKAPLFKGDVHRGLGGLTEEQVKSFTPGAVISMDSTSSWTKDKHTAEAFVEMRKDRNVEGSKGVVLTIKDSKSTHDIEGIGRGAKLASETLSTKGAKYRVVSITDVNSVEPFPTGHPTSGFQKPSRYTHVVLEELSDRVTSNYAYTTSVKIDDFKILHVTSLSVNERWRFHATDEQLKAFQEWLKQQTDLYVRGMTEEELWNRYIQDGFKKGAGRAFDDAGDRPGWDPEEAAFYAGTKEQFLKSAFGRPESLEKVKLLAARTFEELNGMTDDMRNKLGRVLTQGLIQGDGPVAIAREMTKQLDLSRARAETIARTELIRAHAEGQLVGLEEMGVEEVGVMVEWSTAQDDRVCELCEPMEGVVLKIEEARGMIPRHPNCRCAYIPANVAEPTDDQKRSQYKIKKAVKRSAELGQDDFGTAVPVSKKRPEPVLPVITNQDALSRFSQFLSGV